MRGKQFEMTISSLVLWGGLVGGFAANQAAPPLKINQSLSF